MDSEFDKSGDRIRDLKNQIAIANQALLIADRLLTRYVKEGGKEFWDHPGFRNAEKQSHDPK